MYYCTLLYCNCTHLLTEMIRDDLKKIWDPQANRQSSISSKKACSLRVATVLVAWTLCWGYWPWIAIEPGKWHPHCFYPEMVDFHDFPTGHGWAPVMSWHRESIFQARKLVDHWSSLTHKVSLVNHPSYLGASRIAESWTFSCGKAAYQKCGQTGYPAAIHPVWVPGLLVLSRLAPLLHQSTIGISLLTSPKLHQCTSHGIVHPGSASINFLATLIRTESADMVNCLWHCFQGIGLQLFVTLVTGRRCA